MAGRLLPIPATPEDNRLSSGWYFTFKLITIDMEEQRVSLQVSYLLAEHGFYDNRPITVIPTQSLVQKWLREKYGIHLWVEVDYGDDIQYWIHLRNGEHCKNSVCRYLLYTTYYYSYEEALEVGLEEALKLL